MQISFVKSATIYVFYLYAYSRIFLLICIQIICHLQKTCMTCLIVLLCVCFYLKVLLKEIIGELF